MDWFTTSLTTAGTIVLATLGIYAAVVLFTRLNGLRTYSKMSSFDFAITVAVGSVIASTVLSPSTSLLDGVVGLAALFGCQRVVSWARYHRGASAVVDNTPVLLMAGGTFLRDAMAAARITDDDIYAKLREANVLDLAEVRAVVLESTGDISVLHAEPGPKKLDPALLHGVEGRHRLEAGSGSEGSASTPEE